MISTSFVPSRALKGTSVDLFGDYLYHTVTKNIRLMAGKFYSILSDQDIEDLIHDTYIKISDKSGSFRPGGNFDGWVYRICRNSVLDCASQTSKRRGRYCALPQDRDYDERSAYDYASADRKVIQQEEERKIWRVIGNLKPESRELAYMLIDRVPYKEMAIVLGCNENTVKTKVCRFRQELRSYGLVG